MKIGLITDIHNNLAALDAMLKVFEKQDCDDILCCGDIMGIGPCPEETVQRVMSLPNIKCVLGNHEKYLIQGLTPPYPDEMGEGEAKQHLWEYGLLSDSSRKFIKKLPYMLDLERAGLKILVLHYPMDDSHDYADSVKNPTTKDCREMFARYGADIIVYGHNHNSSFVQDDQKMYINCGSLGCPHKFEGKAKGGILSINAGKVDFKMVTAEYDINEVINKIESIKYPDYELIKHIFYGVK